MKWKIGILAIFVAAALFTIAGCSPQQSAAAPTATIAPTAQPTQSATASPAASPTTQPAQSGEVLLTLDELAAYNGTNGKPAYIAVDGIIYDVTNDPSWKSGTHKGFAAGTDLTTAIREQSKHGTSKLEGLPVVGKIKQ